jgi:Flp pilus assembly protein TadD
VSASTLNNLGIALERQGRLAEARRFFASALEDDPNLHEARENLKRVEGGF